MATLIALLAILPLLGLMTYWHHAEMGRIAQSVRPVRCDW